MVAITKQDMILLGDVDVAGIYLPVTRFELVTIRV